MTRKTLWWGLLAVLVVVSLALSACGNAATKAPEASPAATAESLPTAEEKSVMLTLTGEVESLNPLYASTWYTEVVFDLIHLPLWNIDNNGEYHLELAEELPTLENGGVSGDGLTITIKFRPEAVWSDGEPVTAQDAVFTYNMIMDPGNAVFTQYPYDTYVKSMTALDDKTLEIKLTSPYADWATGFFTGLSRVLPEHILKPVFDKEGTLDNAEWNRTGTVVNGPFLVTDFEAGSSLSFVANDKYWRGRPKLDKFFIRIVEDSAAQLAALAAGDSDIGSYIVGSDVKQLEAMGNQEIMTAASGLISVIFMNVDPKTAHPAMTDPNVRRAIALAINRQLIIDQLYSGIYHIPATYWDDTIYDNLDLKPYPFDPEQSKTLLEDAGWKDANSDGVREKNGRDLELRYVYISGEQATDTMVVTIQQMLADVGIKIDILPNTQEVLWASYADGGLEALGQYDLTHWSDGMWYFPSPDTSYFISSEIPSADYPNGYNWFGIRDAKLDELFPAGAGEINPQKRVKIYQQIGQIMYDQTYIIPIRNDPDVWTVNNRLANVQFSGVDPLMFAYEWDVK
jgi:peptide/nickel transport system substrate-binding protein